MTPVRPRTRTPAVLTTPGAGCGGELAVAVGTGDHVACHVADPVWLLRASSPHQIEGGVHTDAVGLARTPLACSVPTRLRTLQLSSEDLGAAGGALLQESDRGDVGQALDDPYVGGPEATGVGAEEVQRSDHLLAVPTWEGEH